MALLTPHKTINYYHWITEVLGNLWLLKNAGLPINYVDQYLMGHSGAAWQEKILQLAGMQPERITPIGDLEDQFIDRMLLPSWGEVTSHSLPDWLSDAIHASIGFSRPQAPGTRRVYLSRQNASRRRVLNEHSLIERLRAHGFECHECGDLSFRQQQDLLASAGVVVAPHGAALTNLLWCAPQTDVIELHAHRHQDQSFHLLARQLRLRYRSHSIAGPSHSSRTREDDLELDDCDLAVVEWLVRDALNNTAT
ncbi:glycosyltransferase family 61 protein [Halorhodospira sp. 9621]|uniref:glycosyltransferase family 61 protein n=1 Tax=Halorhodospira sp. 9621 TaxID=2899135 RepID=UPI001EE8F99D|nr:glycosyltransferase family 61 protein [Halorhodospira sp. 9621]MCG5533622.1 glycosyltransferase family 61 protein [Halorhodospira sp. 9621]